MVWGAADPRRALLDQIDTQLSAREAARGKEEAAIAAFLLLHPPEAVPPAKAPKGLNPKGAKSKGGSGEKKGKKQQLSPEPQQVAEPEPRQSAEDVAKIMKTTRLLFGG